MVMVLLAVVSRKRVWWWWLLTFVASGHLEVLAWSVAWREGWAEVVWVVMPRRVRHGAVVVDG